MSATREQTDVVAAEQESRHLLRPTRMIGAVALVMLLLAAFNFLVNPFGVWPVLLVSHDYAKATRDRVFAGYAPQLAVPVHTALVGSSRTRSGFWVESGVKDGVLNAGMPAATLRETAAMVVELSERDDLKRIVWEASFFNYGSPWSSDADELTLRRMRRDLGLCLSETLFSQLALKSSYRLLVRQLRGLEEQAAWPIPWPLERIAQDVRERRATFREDLLDVEYTLRGFCRNLPHYELDPERLELARGGVKRARSRGKEIVFYVPPVTEYHLEVIRQSGLWDTFQDWKRKLAAIAPVWDFSGYGRLCRELYRFRDANHFGPALGWTMYRRMAGEDLSRADPEVAWMAEAGQLLTAASVEAHSATQNAALAAAVEAPSKYQDRARELLDRYRDDPNLAQVAPD